MSTRAYCTILARNYLPSALTLNDSIARQEPGATLYVVVIDARAYDELPDLPGVRYLLAQEIGLGERTVDELLMSYDLVEFATAIKPPLLKLLLEHHEEVAYIDPDMYFTTPLEDIGPALNARGGIVLTPHFLFPVPPGAGFSEGHLLHVGVFNLGFCAVNRQAVPFLDWWWEHLKGECLHDPLSGLFVDQKWVDLGAVLFNATALRHAGYNIGVANLHERPVQKAPDGTYVISSTGDPLRLFHFHAFDPTQPEALYTRMRTGASAGVPDVTEATIELAREYAAQVLKHRETIGPQSPYRYNEDSSGRPISRRLRKVYRAAWLANPGTLPSAFELAEADAFSAWRKQARTDAGKVLVSDLAKGTRLVFPDEYGRIRQKLPGIVTKLRGKLVEDGGFWG